MTTPKEEKTRFGIVERWFTCKSLATLNFRISTSFLHFDSEFDEKKTNFDFEMTVRLSVLSVWQLLWQEKKQNILSDFSTEIEFVRNFLTSKTEKLRIYSLICDSFVLTINEEKKY